MFYYSRQNQIDKKILIKQIGLILSRIKDTLEIPDNSLWYDFELFFEDLNTDNQSYALEDRMIKVYNQELLNFLDIKQLDSLSEKIKQILDKSQDKKSDLQKLISDTSSEFSKFAFNFQILAAAWLYHQPEIIFANQEKFNLIFDKLDKTQEEKNSLVRYLSQSLHQNDFVAADWALEYLNKATFLEINYELFNQVAHITALFLVFKNFSHFSLDDQEIIIKYYLLDAIKLEMPVEEILGRRLGEASELNTYIVYSGRFATALETSSSLLLPSESASIQELIKNYLEFYQTESKPEQAPEKFLTTWIRNNSNFKNATLVLKRLLEIYTNLRECNLIDYAGMLSDEGEKPKFDWNGILNSNTEELTLEEQTRIKDYLALIDRPIRMKIEMILAFSKVNWQDQKLLPKVLALSDLYEEVYGVKYGQLVFFDENDSVWKLNKNLPSFEAVIK